MGVRVTWRRAAPGGGAALRGRRSHARRRVVQGTIESLVARAVQPHSSRPDRSRDGVPALAADQALAARASCTRPKSCSTIASVASATGGHGGARDAEPPTRAPRRPTADHSRRSSSSGRRGLLLGERLLNRARPRVVRASGELHDEAGRRRRVGTLDYGRVGTGVGRGEVHTGRRQRLGSRRGRAGRCDLDRTGRKSGSWSPRYRMRLSALGAPCRS